MKRIYLTFFCLALACDPCLAAETVTITPVQNPMLELYHSQTNTPACQAGNLNAPAFAVSGWAWGNDTYKYLFDAVQAECSCPAGFNVAAVHFMMQFSEIDVPFTFECAVDLSETIYDETLECNLPGPEICQSQIYTVTIDLPGVYDIGLPIDTSACDCAHFGYKYAIGVTIPTSFLTSPELVTDDMPVGCTSYSYQSGFWEDLTVDAFFPGELNMYADLECCADPVGAAEHSWGSVKSLFK
jgi:hypothetical protein